MVLLPRVRKRSARRRAKRCHRPFQKERGLDREISRAVLLRPCLQLRPSTDPKLDRLKTMIPRLCLSLPGSEFLWEGDTWRPDRSQTAALASHEHFPPG